MEDYMVRSAEKEGSTSGSNFKISEPLTEAGGLRTITEIMDEKGPKATKLMKNLTNVIEVKKRRLEAIEIRYMETRETISKLLAQNEKLNRLYYEEIKDTQFSIREHFQWICNDHEIQSSKLERKQRELELRSLKLQKREAVNKNKRKKLTKVIKENAAINSSLCEKRKEKLADDHKREMENLHQKILFLEKQLNPKQALEDLRMKLKEKEEELMDLKSFTQVVSVKERSNNDEMQETCKALVKGLKKLPQDAHIGVKRIGELAYKPFYDAIKRIYNEAIAEERALDLCSMWEEYLRDLNWHPFRVIIIIGQSQEVINEEDEKLKSLKRDLGDEVYKVVTTALTDINNYNPNKRFFKEELWNFSESRKATLEEGISCFLKMCDLATHEPTRPMIAYSRRENRAT